ncbi:hypothetical protein TYRP_016064 [Tyrophagus putrescentiae]|nr:hypothetical protein TYRP_016064 [Tyrophagus putrescentiae]
MSSTEAPAKRRIELTTVQPKEGEANPNKKIKKDDAKPESANPEGANPEGANPESTNPEGAHLEKAEPAGVEQNSFLNFALYSTPQNPEETKVNELIKTYINEFVSNHSQNVKAAKDITTVISYHDNLTLELKRYSTPSEYPSNPLPMEEKRKKIIELTKTIAKVQDKIKKFETRELTLDEMENDTIFTKISKLKNTLIKLWRKRESYNNHSTALIGQQVFKKFTYTKTKNAQVNLLVEKYYGSRMQKLRDREDKAIFRNSSSSMPVAFDDLNVIELREFLEAEIKKAKIDYTVSEGELIQIFNDLVRERNRRRWNDLNEDFIDMTESRDLKPDSLPDENDEDFKKTADENKKLATAALKKVLADYVEKDKELNKQCADPEYLGQDDVGENEMDLDDEEEEEKEGTEEDSADDGNQTEKADNESAENETTDKSVTGSELKEANSKTVSGDAIVESTTTENGRKAAPTTETPALKEKNVAA